MTEDEELKLFSDIIPSQTQLCTTQLDKFNTFNLHGNITLREFPINY